MHCGIVLDFILPKLEIYVTESGNIAQLGNRSGLTSMSIVCLDQEENPVLQADGPSKHGWSVGTFF